MNSLYSLKNIAPDYFRKLLAVFNEDEVIIVQVAGKKFMIPVRCRISEMFNWAWSYL